MTSPTIQQVLDLADESHHAAQVLINNGLARFSVAQSYYTMFYLAEALLLTKDLSYSSHSAVIASLGKEFAKTGLIDPQFHRQVILAQRRREIGHYGAGQNVTDAEAIQSFQWATEFMQAVKDYIAKL